MSFREKFFQFDDTLASHGVPPLTEWWREGIGRWLDAYESGQVLELLACVGRGAAKSTVLYKLALFFSLFGTFDIPPGERHFAVVLSRLKEEASKGIAIIGAWCGLLGVAHHTAGDVIEFEATPRGVRVVAASVAATSGWRAYFVGKDERSKWQAEGAEQLDAEEVDTSASAMTATHALAPVVTVGSAWGAFGGFYDAVTGGSDASRIVLGPAPTWIAAPHISEASCRKKERDPRKFAREYLCEFTASALAAFDSEDIARAMLRRPSALPGSWIGVCDPSSGSIDTFSYCAVGHAEGLFVFASVGGIPAAEKVTAEEAVNRIATRWRKAGITLAVGDQRESWALTSLFAKYGIQYHPLPWTASTKPIAVEQVRRWLADGTVSLPNHAPMKQELLSFEEKIMPSGQLTFSGRRGGHDDYVALLLTAALADAEGLLPSQSPAVRKVERKLLDGLRQRFGGGSAANDPAAFEPGSPAWFRARGESPPERYVGAHGQQVFEHDDGPDPTRRPYFG